MSQNPQVIELNTAALGSFIHSEALAAAGSAIIPGMLIEETSTGTVQEHSTAAGAAQALFALANPANGGTIDDIYAVGETVRYGAAHKGQEVYGLVAAAATAIPKGSPVESAGDGTVRVLAAGVIIGYALEAVDNSGGGSVARIPLRVA